MQFLENFFNWIFQRKKKKEFAPFYNYSTYILTYFELNEVQSRFSPFNVIWMSVEINEILHCT